MPTDRWRRTLSVTVLTALIGPALGYAATPSKGAAPAQPVDLGLLEFLGSADPTSNERQAGGGRWMVYLSKLNFGTATRSRAKPASTPALKPAAGPDPSPVGSR